MSALDDDQIEPAIRLTIYGDERYFTKEEYLEWMKNWRESKDNPLSPI
jgi:hypothetical protein